MSQELQADYIAGKVVYFLLRNSVGSIWNGAAFEAYVTANYATYDIAATEQGTASGYYVATMPATALGVYYIVAKEQIGGGPAETDITVGTGTIQWTGSVATVIPASGVIALASGQSVSIYSGQLSGQLVNLLSGNQVQVWSGTQVNLFSGQLSGQPITLLSGFSFVASGVQASVFSGQIWLASGHPAHDKSGYILSSGGLDQITVEVGMNFRQSQVVMAAALAGRLSGAGTTSILIDGAFASGTNRIDAVVTASGNRTAVVLTLPT